MSILHFIPTRVNQKLINLHKRVYFTVKKGNIEFLKKWKHEFLQTWFGLHIKKNLKWCTELFVSDDQFRNWDFVSWHYAKTSIDANNLGLYRAEVCLCLFSCFLWYIISLIPFKDIYSPIKSLQGYTRFLSTLTWSVQKEASCLQDICIFINNSFRPWWLQFERILCIVTHHAHVNY
jgi:hypothetical protein